MQRLRVHGGLLSSSWYSSGEQVHRDSGGQNCGDQQNTVNKCF